MRGIVFGIALSTVAGTPLQYDTIPGETWFGKEAVRRARSPHTVLKLHMMSDKGLGGMGAVCLDGSDAGFYFAPSANPDHARDWQIYFQGGGWCYDELACLLRSNTTLGSSKTWESAISAGGIMSDDCKVNPDLCDFNRVYIRYCDGASFSGNRDHPLTVTGRDGKAKPIYFRGRRIMDAVLETLKGFGLGTAQTVLLTGCSAGGLATYLHADYVHLKLQALAPALTKFRAAPISGFFLLHQTVYGRPVYPDQMKHVFQMANSSHGVNDNCIAASLPELRWQCIFASHSYAHMKTPTFELNSAADSWQLENIYTNYDGGWKRCLQSQETGCSDSQLSSLNKYISDYMGTAWSSDNFGKDGNGAFLHSCTLHCEAQSDLRWASISVRGTTMQEAFSKWWNGPGNESADIHTYSPCFFREEAPHQCNPTCIEKGAGSNVLQFI